MTTATQSQDVSGAEIAVGTGLRAIEFAPVVLIGLLICPPLAILAVLVVVPLLAMALVVGLFGLVLAAPYVLFQSLRGHHGHAALFAHRLRAAAHAVLNVAPHRVLADARHAR